MEMFYICAVCFKHVTATLLDSMGLQSHHLFEEIKLHYMDKKFMKLSQ